MTHQTLVEQFRRAIREAEGRYFAGTEKLEAVRQGGHAQPFDDITESWMRRGLMSLYQEDGLPLVVERIEHDLDPIVRVQRRIADHLRADHTIGLGVVGVYAYIEAVFVAKQRHVRALGRRPPRIAARYPCH